jgi:asparagine synthase (glutamine-hydrolysing)
MCGIAGILNFSGSPADRDVLRRMGEALVHRGPDGNGEHVRGSLGFAHRRLAVIDPSGGAQPLVDPATGDALTYNGEVYNFHELRRELGDRNFSTTSDTEVVLRAYQRWGIECLARFRGMFAFALHDARAGKVYLVRDRLGIKPLYYALDSRRLVFASELEALMRSGLVPAAVDRASLEGYLRFGYVPTPRTIFSGANKLDPGCYLEIDLGSGVWAKRRYWRLEPRVRERNDREALEELNGLLEETIRLYVRSDVPYGVLLSGGVDSSLMTAAMARSLGTAPRSFTIGFAEEDCSELPYAAEASRVVGTDHHALVVSPEMSAGLLTKLAGHFGEPFADSSAIPTFAVARMAAAGVKMVLSGDGGDELFGGYDSYADVFARIEPAGLRQRVLQAVAHVAGGAALGRRRLPDDRPWQSIHHAQRDTFSPVERDRLMGAAWSRSGEDELSEPAAADPVTRCQYRDLHTYLLDDILVKVDRMSMANSLEVRVPLLDHKIVEFAFALPLSLKLRRGSDGRLVRKYLLKRSAQRFFAPSFLERPKRGFGIPARAWIDGPLKPLVVDLLDHEPGGLEDYLDARAVRLVVREYYQGRTERMAQIWNLLSLRLWLEQRQALKPSTSGEFRSSTMPVAIHGQVA